MRIFVSVVIFTSVVTVKSFILFEVFPSNDDQTRQLKLFGEYHNVIFSSPTQQIGQNYPVEVLVPLEKQEVFGEFLMCRGMNFNVVFNDNDQSTLENDYSKKKYKKPLQKGEINFEAYHSLDVIKSYLKNLKRNYPKLVDLEKIGESSEGRDIIVVKISSGGNETKPLIFIEAGIHGVEWIAPAQALYIIRELVENSLNKNLIEKVDWIILPVANPDAYEFSFTVKNVINWRKTRSKGINCIGTDANRNFDFHWGEVGASNNECQDTYHGPTPFSEPEARALRDLILKYSDRMKLYLSFHCFGQFILYPWGYTTEPPLNVDELDTLGKHVALTVENIAGTRYAVGSIPNMLYKTSGDSISWAMGVAKIDLAFVIELPPKLYSADISTTVPAELPPKCIKFAVTEIFEGIKFFHDYVDYKYSIN